MRKSSTFFTSLNRSLKTPPPPQRQGVIQRHNTGGSKPSSPAPNRLHVMQHHYPPPGERMTAGVKEQRALTAATLAGHEAFSSLVDVAVQQPLLPVPQDKRPPNFQGSPATHHDIRLHHMAFQLHQHQRFQQLQQVGKHFRVICSRGLAVILAGFQQKIKFSKVKLS